MHHRFHNSATTNLDNLSEGIRGDTTTSQDLSVTVTEETKKKNLLQKLAGLLFGD